MITRFFLILWLLYIFFILFIVSDFEWLANLLLQSSILSYRFIWHVSVNVLGSVRYLSFVYLSYSFFDSSGFLHCCWYLSINNVTVCYGIFRYLAITLKLAVGLTESGRLANLIQRILSINNSSPCFIHKLTYFTILYL